jgi:two-component system nitrogen regulation response regulator NtrX
LRSHKEDLAMLVDALLLQLGARHQQRADVTPEAMSLLRRYDWPGNVRELRNALERSLVLCDGDEITSLDLPEEIREYADAAAAGRAAKKPGDDSFLGEPDFREAKRQFEIVYLRRKLEEHHWNVSQTAAEVGLHRQSLQEKLRELGIQRPGK